MSQVNAARLVLAIKTGEQHVMSSHAYRLRTIVRSALTRR